MKSASKKEVSVHIRCVIRRDMPEILDIEKKSFSCAWSEEDFLRTLRQKNCIGMVCEVGELVIGYMIYELHKEKLHILNLAVSSDFRHQGVGTKMLNKLKSKLSTHRRKKLDLEVRETNLAAQLFFKANGFKAICIMRGVYEDNNEDAYLMAYVEKSCEDQEVEETQHVNRCFGR